MLSDTTSSTEQTCTLTLHRLWGGVAKLVAQAGHVDDARAAAGCSDAVHEQVRQQEVPNGIGAYLHLEPVLSAKRGWCVTWSVCAQDCKKQHRADCCEKECTSAESARWHRCLSAAQTGPVPVCKSGRVGVWISARRRACALKVGARARE